MKKALSLIFALVLCLSLCACSEDTPTVPNDTEPSTTVHTHNWKDATCDAPKTCSSCGATEGFTLDHQWTRESCADPYTCSLCNATNGEGDKHSVYDGVCSGCGKTLEELEKEPGYQYQLALELLSAWDSGNEEREMAYQLLSGLDDYKDAADYLSRITVIPDVRLYWICEESNAFGEVSWSEQLNYHYNAMGLAIAAPNCEYYGANSLPWQDYYSYDDQGRVIQKDSHSMGIGDTNTMYIYNDAGQLVETKVLVYENTYSLTKHFYNEAGQEIRFERLYADGRETVVTYTYDDSGNRIRMEQVDNGGEAIVTTYEYDSAGRKIHSKRDIWEWNYEYDSDGKLVFYSYIYRWSGDECYTKEVHYSYENNKLISVKFIQHDYDDVYEYVTNYIYGDYYCYTPAE